MHEQILIFTRKSNDTNPSIDDLFERTDRHVDSIQLDVTPSATKLTSLFRDYCVDITVAPYIAKEDEVEDFDTPIYEIEFGDSVRYGQMMYRNSRNLRHVSPLRRSRIFTMTQPSNYLTLWAIPLENFVILMKNC